MSEVSKWSRNRLELDLTPGHDWFASLVLFMCGYQVDKTKLILFKLSEASLGVFLWPACGRALCLKRKVYNI